MTATPGAHGVHDSNNQSPEIKRIVLPNPEHLRYRTTVRSNIAKPKPIATIDLSPCELPAPTNAEGYCLIYVILVATLFCIGGHKNFFGSMPDIVGKDITDDDKSNDFMANGTEYITRNRSTSLRSKPESLKNKTKRGENSLSINLTARKIPTTIPSMNPED